MLGETCFDECTNIPSRGRGTGVEEEILLTLHATENGNKNRPDELLGSNASIISLLRNVLFSQGWMPPSKDGASHTPN